MLQQTTSFAGFVLRIGVHQTVLSIGSKGESVSDLNIENSMSGEQPLHQTKSVLHLLAGYVLTWNGQYEFMQRMTQKLRVVPPVTLAIIFLLLYLNFRSIAESVISA